MKTKRMHLALPLLLALAPVAALPATPALAGGYLQDVGEATVDVLPNAGRRGAEAANAAAAELGPVGGILGGLTGVVLGAGEGVFKTFVAVIGAD